MGVQKDIYESYWTHGIIDQSYRYWKINLLKNYIRNNDNILDIGCGDGDTCHNFARDNEVFGIDISEFALKKAIGKGLKACVCNIDDDKFPFKDGSFDVVLILDVLEHTMDPVTVIKEAKRTLSKNGLMIVTVPNALNLMNRLYFLSGKFVDVFDQSHRYEDRLFTEHIRIFSKDILERLIMNEGLKMMERHYYFPQRFEENRWKKFQLICDFIYKTKMHQKLPALFSLGFFYALKKSV